MIRHWALLIGLLLGSPQILAHQQSLSYSNWEPAPAGLSALIRHQAVDLSRARLHPAQADYLQGTGAWLAGQIEVRRGGQRCDTTEIQSQHGDQGWILTRLHWDCGSTGQWQIHYDGLLDLAPNHTNLAQWRGADGGLATRVFNENQRVWRVGAGPMAGQPLDFVRLGIEHILGGWDHLAFLLALLLLVHRASDLLWLVTGFTLAHSLTLMAAGLRLTSVNAGVVEAIIALSILLLCLENAWRIDRGRWPAVLGGVIFGALLLSPVMPTGVALGLGLAGLCYALVLPRPLGASLRLRLALCFGFGLFHGFGFAGVLLDMQLPDRQLFWTLLAFNLGVELGQLLFVLPLWGLLRWISSPHREQWLAPINATAAALASYWLVIRLLPPP